MKNLNRIFEEVLKESLSSSERDDLIIDIGHSIERGVYRNHKEALKSLLPQYVTDPNDPDEKEEIEDLILEVWGSSRRRK
jgi:hypothetical protein